MAGDAQLIVSRLTGVAVRFTLAQLLDEASHLFYAFGSVQLRMFQGQQTADMSFNEIKP